jgi:predicted nucleic acid-binding protein
LIFLDTSGLLCLHHVDEPQHSDTLTFFGAAGPKITHDYVLAEFVTLAMVRGLPRRQTLAYVSALIAHPEVEVVWVDEPLYRQALHLLEAQADKRYSLCDAVSFVLMAQRRMRDALTTDHHFEQGGYVRLLGP